MEEDALKGWGDRREDGRLKARKMRVMCGKWMGGREEGSDKVGNGGD